MPFHPRVIDRSRSTWTPAALSIAEVRSGAAESGCDMEISDGWVSEPRRERREDHTTLTAADRRRLMPAPATSAIARVEFTSESRATPVRADRVRHARPLARRA